MGTVKLPQLRVRTEYSFRQAFGPTKRVAAALKELDCPAAAMVDIGTWGHVNWHKELTKNEIKPLFGTEIPILHEDGRKPSFWVLATDIRKFYRFSTATQQPGANFRELLEDAQGVIRFAGAALTDPDHFDYIDINPASLLQQRAALRLHERTSKPLVITSDNGYPTLADRNAFLAFDGRAKLTPQHLLSYDELHAALPVLSDKQFSVAYENCLLIADQCASELPKAEVIQVEGDLTALVLRGKEERLRLGHIKHWTDEYEARLKRELDMIASKGYESYFLVVADLVMWAKQRMLVGPGRGSSAGSLVCYLLRITEIDPLPHGLLFERFIDVTRDDLPDIDIDFNEAKRDECFSYLADKYGADKVARIGNINTMKPKTVIAKVCERLAIKENEKYDVLNVLVEYWPGDARYGHGLRDTMAGTEPGRQFLLRHPEAAVMFDLENHASHTGVHAAGVIVCNEPIGEFCTVGADGVIHGDKPYAEAVNLLKIDALGLRTLGILEDAGCVTANELYALPLDDPKVFDVFNSQKYVGIFQFEGESQRNVSKSVDVNSFRRIDQLTALARPGPLGSGASKHFIERAAGREPVIYRHPSMAAYLAPTMGIILYQEQVMRICNEIGQFDWERTSKVRKAMSARKGKEFFNQHEVDFVAGATKSGLSPDDAAAIWHEICTFGEYGMNASHTTSYGVISYWCAYMKAYHSLAYAAACLRNVKDDDQAMELLREMVLEGVNYTPFDIERSQVDWSVVDGELIGGFMNLFKTTNERRMGFGVAKATKAVEQRQLGTLDREKIATMEIKFSELYPIARKYSHIYSNPQEHGVREGSIFSRSDRLPYSGDTLIICTVQGIKRRDENEVSRIARRKGNKRMEDQTQFLDLECMDDGGRPMTIRIKRELWFSLGKQCLELLKKGDDIMVRGMRVQDYMIIRAERIKCLNREVVLYA